jgi:transcriptional regulator with XRE-family HTH domain
MDARQDPDAVEIGKEVMRLRLDRGYTSRVSLVESRPLKNKLTEEGLRKIEAGERVPRVETLHRICKALGLSARKTKILEKRALEKVVERAARRSGNIAVKIEIEGSPVFVPRLPPPRKVETFVRDSVTDLVEIVRLYGVMERDLDHFRMHARAVLHRKLNP